MLFAIDSNKQQLLRLLPMEPFVFKDPTSMKESSSSSCVVTEAVAVAGMLQRSTLLHLTADC
jgi:hypothetical protein